MNHFRWFFKIFSSVFLSPTCQVPVHLERGIRPTVREDSFRCPSESCLTVGLVPRRSSTLLGHYRREEIMGRASFGNVLVRLSIDSFRPHSLLRAAFLRRMAGV